MAVSVTVAVTVAVALETARWRKQRRRVQGEGGFVLAAGCWLLSAAGSVQIEDQAA